ncbi:MAG: hypothetical protein ISS77_07000 [Phycisphaerae bacterium]|nr:hypothetical protein [Phycisphaerae bacterium]
MRWGDAQTPSGNYAGAYKYDFGLDPDLTNCTIQITVTAPQFGPSGQINQVSFSIVDIGGLRRSWWWQVGPAGGGTPIEWNVSKTVKINTAVTGLGAANPIATGFLNTAGFNLTQSQSFDVDENGQWIFGQVQVPPPGSPTIFVGLWNYWHNLTVTQNTKAYKGSYPKWTQGPVVINEDNPPLILGWDEPSDYNNGPVMADDWECSDERPVTDIHWWGSFLGWTQPELPPILPKRFHIGIWTDVPVSAGNTFSHPGALIWENYCDSWVWNFAGYDEDPRPDGMENEACFQFNQLLSQDEWFHQHPMEDGMPNVYWLSIAAIYDAADYQSTDFYPWGWKTREHFYNDDAVRVMDTDLWPIRIGSNYTGGNPVELFNPQTEQMESWDLAFELTTNEELPQPPSGDVDGSGLVDFSDLAILADQWLTAGP